MAGLEQRIDEHRKTGRGIPFDILVWGPSKRYAEEYKLRQSIKNHLIKKGHKAKFSEDLIKEGEEKPAPDPIIDEIFHAREVNLIVVLFGSPGTIIEFYTILRDNKDLAEKSLILAEESMVKSINEGVGRYIWRKFPGKILSFKEFNEKEVLDKLDEFIEDRQFGIYLDIIVD